jgi:hypothetical protein|tara:strand:- start:502 stop:726 length:225 start_codon:yes stop_codon:yes gene_type:complete
LVPENALVASLTENRPVEKLYITFADRLVESKVAKSVVSTVFIEMLLKKILSKPNLLIGDIILYHIVCLYKKKK